MPVWFQSLVILMMVWVIARLIKRRTKLLQRFFIPSSIVGGVLLILIGPQVVGVVPSNLTAYLATLPALLINIVFAGLFIGKKVPKPREIWRSAGSMISFGNTIAWGMYVLAILLVLLFLGPLFGAPALFGSLLEMSFSGGHGTAAGFAPVVKSLGSPGVTDLALGLATFSIITTILLGLVIINIYNRRLSRALDKNTMGYRRNQMAKYGYSLTRFTRWLELNPKDGLLAGILLLLAILIGWVLLKGLGILEDFALGGLTDIRVFKYLPLFPLAMFGGLIVQSVMRLFHIDKFINISTVQVLSSIALDLLIVTAIGTVSLNVIASNWEAFLVLALTGVTWILFVLFYFGPKIYRKYWFEYAMTDFGQAMGTTATGLLINRLVDPLNRTGAREAFAYKQLAYEPFMGGGIATALMVVLIANWGLVPCLVLSSCMMLFWLTVGLVLGRRSGGKRESIGNIGSFIVKVTSKIGIKS